MKLKLHLLLSLFYFINHAAKAQAVIVSQFDFNNNLNDTKGNGQLMPHAISKRAFSNGKLNWQVDSGTITGGGFIYQVPKDLLNINKYSIALTFSFSEVIGYRKVIDFEGAKSDRGLYFNNNFRLYPSIRYIDTILEIDKFYTLLYTKDTANDSSYLYYLNNGKFEYAASISNKIIGYDVILRGNNTRELRFFNDDSSTQSEFSPKGVVDQIIIWNGIANFNDFKTVSTKNLSVEPDFTIFPNPSKGSINIKSQQFINQVDIIDLQGKVILSKIDLPQNSVHIEMFTYKKGLNFIRINNLYTKKIWID